MEQVRNYIPSDKEIESAEAAMADEQKKSTEKRVENWEQKMPWDEGEINFDANNERKKPTEKDIERMSLSINEVGKLFKSVEYNWFLDGAINISLMKGEFIGVHKDIDISVERNELRDIESFLERKGYGFFHAYSDESGEIIWHRVGCDGVASSMFGHYAIVAVDQDGKIIEDKKPNFIDLHIIERNEKGLPINRSGTILPDKWFRPKSVKYQSEIINISHPALVAYYKLQFWREYDLTDLRALAESDQLTLQDVNDIKEIVEKNFINNERRIRDIVDKVAVLLRDDMSTSEILDVLVLQPDLRGGIQYKKELFSSFAEKIAKSKDKTNNGIMKLAFEAFSVEDAKKQMRDKLATFKRWVEYHEKQ